LEGIEHNRKEGKGRQTTYHAEVPGGPTYFAKPKELTKENSKKGRGGGRNLAILA